MQPTLYACLEDPRQLWEQRVCLRPVSKNLRGELRLNKRERQDCDEEPCKTLKTDHGLRLEVHSHQPCDSEPGKQLDGTLFVRRLVHALINSGEGRGLHTGHFEWVGDQLVVEGVMSGMTNEGTHREPVFQPCQVCDERGVMEGRLCGRVVRAKDERLIGCNVAAAYRLRFDASEGFRDTGVEGTLEGLLVCRCADEDCLELSAFPSASHANPWSIGTYTFGVTDHTGSPTPSADVIAMGVHTGLNVSFETKIELASPTTSGVDITLVHFATPPTVTGYDTSGAAVDSAVMTVAGSPQTLSLSGAISTLVVNAPNDETLLLRLCIH